MSLLFSIDTSSHYIVLALGDERRLIAGESLRAERAHQAQLHPLIKKFLKTAGVTWADIDCLGVVAGPGSFTGLRIGIAAIKGFAWALKKPVVTVSALDCLADNLIGTERDVVPVIDARRSCVYTACYRGASQGIMKKVLSERLAEPARWAKRLKRQTIFLGDGIERYPDVFVNGVKRFDVASESLWTIQPVALWSRCRQAYRKKDFVSLKRLGPKYFRLPEAIETYNKRKAVRR